MKSVSRADALKTIAGLQLTPTNAHQLQRLERAAALIQAHAHGHASASPSDLVNFVNRDPLRAEYAHLEDPVEGLICEEVMAPGGSYLAGAGMSGQSIFCLRLLIRVLYERPWSGAEALLGKTTEAVMTALAAGDRTLRQAGLGRSSAPAGEPGGYASVPADIDRLAGAATFDLTAPGHIGLAEALAPLVQQGRPTLRRGTDYAPVATPFVRIGDELILTLPFEIASSIRHLVVNVALAADLGEELHLRYLLAAHEQASNALARMNWRPLHRDDAQLPWPETELPMAESIFGFDDDKVAHLVVLGDDLRGYDGDRVFQSWELGEDAEHIAGRLSQVREHLLKRSDVIEVLSLLVFVPLDRGVGFRVIPGASEGVLSLPLLELEVLSRLDGDPLALWKFARAYETRHAPEIHAFSMLDLYAMYRDLGRTFQMVDRPEAIVVRPGHGGALRQDAVLRADVHPVPHPLGIVSEVERWLPQAPTVPIYLPRNPIGTEVCVVEIADSWVWISGPSEGSGPMLAFTIAYWLWQIGGDVADELGAAADENGVVDLRLELEPRERWRDYLYDTDEEIPVRVGQPAFQVRVSDSGVRTLRLLENAWCAFHAGDNSGERQLVSALLALFEIDDDVEAVIVERHAPLGYKKHMFMGRGPDPRLNDRNLPPYRPVCEHDEHEVNELVSAIVIRDLKLEPGPIGPTDSKRVLDAYVGAAFDKLREQVAATKSQGLIEGLVAAVERCTHEQVYRQASALTKTLAYGDADETLAERDLEVQQQNRSAVCARFLVEYVAACPPTGNEPLSLATFDRLMALAAEIIDAGSTSDAAEYGLAAAEVVVSPSGRVVFRSALPYQASRTEFVSAYTATEVSKGETVLDSLVWEPPKEIVALPEGLDEALLAETGLSFIDTGAFLNAVIEHAIDVESAAFVQPYGTFVTELAGKLDWPIAKVQQAIAMLTLEPRRDFLHPASPHRRSDVYPWRFNRALSYIRRPLVKRGDDIVYGMRHLFAAQSHLAQLLESGRYRAHSPELRRYLGEMGRRLGRAFEDAVAALFERAECIVRRRVKRIGELELVRENGLPIGDIDVLAIDPAAATIFVVDAKCITPAMTPSEVALEISQLFAMNGKRSAVQALRERTEWVEVHLEDIISASGADSGRAWSVEPLIVVDRDLVSTYLARPDVTVQTYHSLERQLSAR
ncbi:MAG: hypothetical protein AABM30_03150 [Actinomycetota bacterium]